MASKDRESYPRRAGGLAPSDVRGGSEMRRDSRMRGQGKGELRVVRRFWLGQQVMVPGDDGRSKRCEMRGGGEQ